MRSRNATQRTIQALTFFMLLWVVGHSGPNARDAGEAAVAMASNGISSRLPFPINLVVAALTVSDLMAADVSPSSGDDSATKAPNSAGSPALEQPIEETLAELRARLENAPEDADLHLELADALIVGLQTTQDPMAMGQYASELLPVLNRTLALDPEMIGAHHRLAGYYLNAPPFAGGSLEKASEHGERIVELGDPSGGIILAEVEIKQGDVESARKRLLSLLAADPEMESAKAMMERLASAEAAK